MRVSKMKNVLKKKKESGRYDSRDPLFNFPQRE